MKVMVVSITSASASRTANTTSVCGVTLLNAGSPASGYTTQSVAGHVRTLSLPRVMWVSEGLGLRVRQGSLLLAQNVQHDLRTTTVRSACR